MEIRMYARCLNSKDCDLIENFEYRVLEVRKFDGFGESLFYILENGLAYASVHFSVTYLK